MTVLTKLAKPSIENNVLFLSYNSTGFNLQRAEFLTDLISVFKGQRCLLSIQEHFLMSKSLSKIEEYLPSDFCVYSVAAFKENDIKRGRGKGGLAMIWPRCIDKYITRIPVKTCSRVQACLISFPGSKILWLNSYFPHDPQANNFDCTELLEVLSCVKSIIINNDHDHIIWQGDLNTDFSRTSSFVQIVKDAVEDLNLESIWNRYPVDFTFTSPTELTFSTINHYLVNEALKDSNHDAGVIHLGDNVSGHNPIYLALDVGHITPSNEQTRIFSPRQNWIKATGDDKFKFRIC